ncbi:transcriptional regulator, LysR family [Polaromonas naphthalenivorans CJ2]|uniref:Transcriptional regulator, LysR family n=1 Tax=Polaromonas naphthalenivorans (strain CJ2) TaxID=365044 RepID=A1VIZ1_POLNA|nr:transcriptional regulator, LysR family [Polaromonas naphthalenivorans CJ2]
MTTAESSPGEPTPPRHVRENPPPQAYAVPIGAAKRIPPIQCLLTFEALARLRSVTLSAEELCVTPSAVSHRVKQLEQIIGTKLFGRADFSLTTEGSEYLAHVREGLATLQKFPGAAGQSATPGKRKLRLAVTPTFARSMLIPRLRQFTDAYPEIDLTLQVSIPLLDVVAEDSDLVVRFGTGRYADLEHVCLLNDEVTPLASPSFIREHGPFEAAEDLLGENLLRSPLEPWRIWFAANNLDWPEPVEGSQFNDIGLMCDCAAAGMGIALVRLKLGAPWLENGSLVRLGTNDMFTRKVASPHAHYLCWRTGTMDRWECAAFADWLRKSLV